MKIAFMGTHGVGKTTLCFELVAALKRLDRSVDVVKEVARRCPLPINRETTRAAQLWILHNQIAEEIAEQAVEEAVEEEPVVEEAPARFRGILTGILQTGYPLGWFLASLLAAPVLARWGWRPMFLIGLVSIPFTVIIWRFLRETTRFSEHRATLAEAPQAYAELADGRRCELFRCACRLAKYVANRVLQTAPCSVLVVR